MFLHGCLHIYGRIIFKKSFLPTLFSEITNNGDFTFLWHNFNSHVYKSNCINGILNSLQEPSFIWTISVKAFSNIPCTLLKSVSTGNNLSYLQTRKRQHKVILRLSLYHIEIIKYLDPIKRSKFSSIHFVQQKQKRIEKQQNNIRSIPTLTQCFYIF